MFEKVELISQAKRFKREIFSEMYLKINFPKFDNVYFLNVFLVLKKFLRVIALSKYLINFTLRLSQKIVRNTN